MVNSRKSFLPLILSISCTSLFTNGALADSFSAYEGEWEGSVACDGTSITAWGTLGNSNIGKVFRLDWASMPGDSPGTSWSSFMYAPVEASSDHLAISYASTLVGNFDNRLKDIDLSIDSPNVLTANLDECKIRLERVTDSLDIKDFTSQWRGMHLGNRGEMLLVDELGSRIIAPAPEKDGFFCIWRPIGTGQKIVGTTPNDTSICQSSNIQFGSSKSARIAVAMHSQSESTQRIIDFPSLDRKFEVDTRRSAGMIRKIQAQWKRTTVARSRKTQEEEINGAVPWPEAIKLSRPEILGSLDISGLDLTMTAGQISNKLESKIIPKKWIFFNVSGLEPARINREDVGSIRHSNTSQNGSKASVNVQFSKWHTGNVPLVISRHVSLQKTESFLLPDNFISSVAEKYGDTYKHEFARGTRTLGQKKLQFMTYGFMNNQADKHCKAANINSELKEIYSSYDTEKLESLKAEAHPNRLCDVTIKVQFTPNYETDLISSYTVTLIDFKSIREDVINEFAVQKFMRNSYEERYKSGNSNQPEL
ncbi:hypothetical protein [Phaeobacter inhibens]|uniref:hypothetical protein n=1 Tax=Phaeobacter inhibens TaxID=221822 RepID=UPI0021A697FB|nr:hypothetical protein [Phaeobacter inhibens]UWR87824.1 hypothetical protein K4L01_13795 [Phaeobacter inhibens]